MSIALMSAVWRTDLPTTDKMVLLALADAANDDGVTWMALESQDGVKLDLIKKTSLSRRAVQGALKRLVDSGYLSRVDRPGKGVIWTVKGCTSCAPQQMRPAADAPGGAAGAPKPSINPQPLSEASASSRDARPKAKASRRAPDGWEPMHRTIRTLEAEGYGPGELERALSMVRDHEFAKPKTDWDAAYRNWVRRDPPARARHDRPDHHNRPSSRDGRLERMLAGAQRAVGPEPGLHPVDRGDRAA